MMTKIPWIPSPRTVLMAYNPTTGDFTSRIFWTADVAQAALDWLVGQGFNGILLEDAKAVDEIE